VIVTGRNPLKTRIAEALNATGRPVRTRRTTTASTESTPSTAYDLGAGDHAVRDGLQTMRDAGLRLVTLTISAPAAVQQQLTNAGLTSFFDRSFSVATVRRFKPAAEAYRSVADSLALPVDPSTARRNARVGYRRCPPCGMRRGIRRATGEGPVSARSEARHHWPGLSERRETDCCHRGPDRLNPDGNRATGELASPADSSYLNAPGDIIGG
jgi:hypothetical protein